MIQRRGFLAGLGALLAAPAIIRTPGLIMPVKAALVSPGLHSVGSSAVILPTAGIGQTFFLENRGTMILFVGGSAVAPGETIALTGTQTRLGLRWVLATPDRDRIQEGQSQSGVTDLQDTNAAQRHRLFGSLRGVNREFSG